MHGRLPWIASPHPSSPHITHTGNFTDLNPGSNISSFYQYGDCSGFPTGASTTPVQTINSPTGSGTLPSFAVGDLEPATTYCVAVCIQDDTAGSGYICTGPQTFSTPKAPEVITLPATNVGVDNTSTLQGEYNSFVVGETLQYYHLVAPCDTYNQSADAMGNGTIPSNPGNGTLPPSTVGPLQAGVDSCTQVGWRINIISLTKHAPNHTLPQTHQACIIGVASNFGLPVCGQVSTFSWTAVVRDPRD